MQGNLLSFKFHNLSFWHWNCSHLIFCQTFLFVTEILNKMSKECTSRQHKHDRKGEGNFKHKTSQISNSVLSISTYLLSAQLFNQLSHARKSKIQNENLFNLFIKEIMSRKDISNGKLILIYLKLTHLSWHFKYWKLEVVKWEPIVDFNIWHWLNVTLSPNVPHVLISSTLERLWPGHPLVISGPLETSWKLNKNLYSVYDLYFQTTLPLLDELLNVSAR